MAATIRKLSLVITAQQYWQLIRALFFNFKVVGYLSIFFLGIACVSYMLAFISPFFKIFGAPIASRALFIFAFVGLVMLPLSILDLINNKHMHTLADVRKKLFIVLCSFCSVFSIFSFVVLKDINREGISTSFLFSIFLMAALYFWLAIFLMRKSLLLFGLAPLLLGLSAKLCASYLIMLQPYIVLLASVIVWGLFYRWWSGVQPKKTNGKPILFAPKSKNVQELPVEKLLHFSSNHVKTSMGSLLLGYGDGSITMIKKLLVIYLTTFLFAVVVCGGFKDGHFTENAFEAVLITLAYAFVMSGIDFFSRRMLVNLSRCWLHFPGNRTDFFLYMESKFFSGLGFLSVLNAGVIILLAWVGGYADYFLYCVAGLVILSLILLWNFYLGIYFYSRNRQGVEEINYRVFLVHAVIFIPAIAYLFLKYQNFNRLGVLDVVATCFVVTLIASLKLMRSNTIKQWQQADF